MTVPKTAGLNQKDLKVNIWINNYNSIQSVISAVFWYGPCDISEIGGDERSVCNCIEDFWPCRASNISIFHKKFEKTAHIWVYNFIKTICNQRRKYRRLFIFWIEAFVLFLKSNATKHTYIGLNINLFSIFTFIHAYTLSKFLHRSLHTVSRHTLRVLKTRLFCCKFTIITIFYFI